ncbi:MAG TPA: mechanosensitive ion channel domain-containing protein [Candidatus Binatia bacterium]|nr:mechanosensitive ion channel domain-containing protein [Candidatus Binatia bacterium]
MLKKLSQASLLGGGIPALLLQGAQALTRLITAAAVLLFIYWWSVFLLNQFSATASWSEQLRLFLFSMFIEFGGGALRALPELFTVVVILLIARWGSRLVNALFNEVESGRLTFSWLERETARTTQTLVLVAIWLFALVVAYPYIPGSNTEAFKGVSVLVGLMITLGSTGLINQIISGLFVIYSRSVRPGDYVRIGDTEGQVVDVGFLATKLMTPRQEEITLPHSVLVGTGTTNYSRLAEEQGVVVTISVTIGYDVPWRQVHALLLLGAARTRGIRSAPAPRVLQRELSDFSVQYHLVAHLREGEKRGEVMSELHAQIQDAFNEFGAQIVSPHFESQPEKKIVVPRAEWHAAPAASSPISDVNGK